MVLLMVAHIRTDSRLLSVQHGHPASSILHVTGHYQVPGAWRLVSCGCKMRRDFVNVFITPPDIRTPSIHIMNSEHKAFAVLVVLGHEV